MISGSVLGFGNLGSADEKLIGLLVISLTIASFASAQAFAYTEGEPVAELDAYNIESARDAPFLGGRMGDWRQAAAAR